MNRLNTELSEPRVCVLCETKNLHCNITLDLFTCYCHLFL